MDTAERAEKIRDIFVDLYGEHGITGIRIFTPFQTLKKDRFTVSGFRHRFANRNFTIFNLRYGGAPLAPFKGNLFPIGDFLR